MEQVNVTVTVDDEHVQVIGDVAATLRERGMDIAQVLDTIGTVTGSVAPERRESLRSVTGVVHVSEDVRHQLPPPDAPVQ